MKPSASIDTNAVISYLTGRSESQLQAVERLMKDHYSLHISDYVFGELEYVFRAVAKMSRQEIVQQFTLLLDRAVFNCNRGMIHRVMPLYLNNSSLSFVDCCLAIQAELNVATPLYTFDKKLANQAKGTAKLIKA